jgi:hypothetical protein
MIETHHLKANDFIIEAWEPMDWFAGNNEDFFNSIDPTRQLVGRFCCSGTPAVVLDDQEVSTILGKSVRSSADEDMGRVVNIVVSRDGQIHAAIIDFGGLLGIGTRKIAIDWRVLNFAPAGRSGAIILELTRNQVRLAPEYKQGKPVVVVGAEYH